ncbi:hypothetical protein EYF80_038365 [Liparis tanakae]|uniref:Uncharacterized protein n=1 Tax=Liparis tanakae TaxID=230148 RepID=A0A4Z2GEY3_9TELE|nr:hypothetical protein EYF80_038365 [Liparis tanakae]
MESDDVFVCTSPVSAVLKRRPDGIPGLSSLSLPELSTKTALYRDLSSPGPATVLSPVTNLALDLTNLAVLGRPRHGSPQPDGRRGNGGHVSLSVLVVSVLINQLVKLCPSAYPDATSPTSTTSSTSTLLLALS